MSKNQLLNLAQQRLVKHQLNQQTMRKATCVAGLSYLVQVIKASNQQVSQQVEGAAHSVRGCAKPQEPITNDSN